MTEAAVKVRPGDASTGRDSLPSWASREVPLESLAIRTRFPVPYSAAREVIRGVNYLKGVDTSPGSWLTAQLARFPRSAVDAFLPMIASVVAHAGDPDVPVLLPTKEDAQKMKQWVAMAPRKPVEKFAGNKLRKFGDNVVAAIEAIGNIPEPRRQFVQEIFQLYQHIVSSDPWREVGVLGGEISKPEEKLADVIDRLLYRVKDGLSDDLFTKEHYPLLTRLFPTLPLPKNITDKVNARTISVAGAEIMSAFAHFLRNEGVYNLPHPPKPSFSLKRGVAKSFYSGELQNVESVLPRMLWDVKNMLPVTNQSFRELCYGYARDIVAATAQGKSSADVTAAVLGR